MYPSQTWIFLYEIFWIGRCYKWEVRKAQILHTRYYIFPIYSYENLTFSFPQSLDDPWRSGGYLGLLHFARTHGTDRAINILPKMSMLHIIHENTHILLYSIFMLHIQQRTLIKVLDGLPIMYELFHGSSLLWFLEPLEAPNQPRLNKAPNCNQTLFPPKPPFQSTNTPPVPGHHALAASRCSCFSARVLSTRCRRWSSARSLRRLDESR